MAKPVNDLSRGALVEDIVYTIALTAVQSSLT
jgi:phosphate acetyltransferase